MPAENVAALRAAVAACLWPGAPGRPGRARAECLSVAEAPDVVLEDLRLHSPANPADPIPAWMVRPRVASGRLPAVVCLHGSGRDRDLLVDPAYGIGAEGRPLRGWARELARRGFVAVAITQRTYGGRPGDMIEFGKTELLYGRTAMGALVADVRAVLDHLEVHPMVVPGAFGVTGMSLGGIVSFYAAVVDERIRAAAPICGGVGSLDALVDHGRTAYHSAYYYVPGLRAVGDHADLTAAVAPRPLLVIGAEHDVGMPVDGLRAFALEAAGTYRRAGRPDALSVHIGPGGHELLTEHIDILTAWFHAQLG